MKATRVRCRLWVDGIKRLDTPRTIENTDEVADTEIEFLDEPDPNTRFLRMGTDPRGMVAPVRLEDDGQT